MRWTLQLAVPTELSIYPADIDVLVLAIRYYPEIFPNTSFITGSATTRRIIKLQPIVEALGSAKAAALPAFHALTLHSLRVPIGAQRHNVMNI